MIRILEKDISNYHEREEKEDLIKKIESANAKFPELFVKPFKPKIKVEYYEDTSKNKYRPWWPDIEKEADSISIRDFLVPLHPIETRTMDCTSIEFFYRPASKDYCPSILCSWFQLFSSQKGKGLGNKLINLAEELSRVLNANEIFLKNVANESFWKHKGYSPFKKHDSQIYWRKFTTSAI